VNASNIALDADIAEFFDAAVQGALESQELRATEAAARYLVALLCDYARPGRHAQLALERPSTFLLRDALEASGPERFRRLRRLGDGILYVLGFFGASVSRRGADRRYVMGVGSSAYRHAAAMLQMGMGSPSGSPDVLGELAGKYPGFVGVLNEVADSAVAESAKDHAAVLRLYERWRQTGSARLAQELIALGLVPTRSARGVQ
jgi:hypothetical protein